MQGHLYRQKKQTSSKNSARRHATLPVGGTSLLSYSRSFVLTRFRPYIALLLLLAFVRVLLPDTAVLALHRHAHTEVEAAHDHASDLRGHTIVSEKHTHCPTDHLFDAPVLPAPTFVFGVVPPLRFPAPQPVALSSVWAARLVRTLCLRGPPAAV